MGQRMPTARQESIRTSGVEFELAYSDDWVDVFDKRLEQAPGPWTRPKAIADIVEDGARNWPGPL